MIDQHPSPIGQPIQAGDPATHRSAAVARMLRMPVATLRVWERRYALTKAGLSPGGQRLYSADDIRRLSLIRQLTDLGHAIGTLAALDMAQLQRVALSHAQVASKARDHRPRLDPVGSPRQRPWRIAVIGQALGRRLQRPALTRLLRRPVALLGRFDDATQAGVALPGVDLDMLLIDEPHLSDGWLAALALAAPELGAVPKAVLYAFAPDPVCDALAAADVMLLRAPQPDAVLAQWLNGLAGSANGVASGASAPATEPIEPVATRRWDDAALVDFTSRPSTIACECRRHLTELLMQLNHFEGYSADCERSSDHDAGLHAHLQRVAALARAGFEDALDQVLLHEGLMLPAASPPDRPGADTAASDSGSDRR